MNIKPGEPGVGANGLSHQSQVANAKRGEEAMTIGWLAEQINPPLARLIREKTLEAQKDFWTKVHRLREQIGESRDSQFNTSLAGWLDYLVWPARRKP